MSERKEGLEADLRNAWVAELYEWWAVYNDDFLSGSLRRPQIVILDTESTLGQWDAERRTLGISASHITASSWHGVLETLRHEMAHQFADEQLNARETPHGPAFRDACARLRVDPRASKPKAQKSDKADPERVRLLSRIQKLLSLADSPNENEATAAFRKARRLMLEHNVELPAPVSGFAIRELGDVKSRHHAWEFVLANILDEFFFVDVIWAHSFIAAEAKRGTVLRAFGTEGNLEMAGYVYDFLTNLLEQLWADYRERKQLKGNRERLKYFHGVLLGLQGKLEREDKHLREKEGLVIVEDGALQEFFRHHNPRVRTVSRGRTRSTETVRDGEAEGRKISIRKPVAKGDGIAGYLDASTD